MRSYELAHDLSGIFKNKSGMVPSDPSAFVRKRAGGMAEGQINEEALKRKALMDISRSGGNSYAPKGVGNLPPGEVSNLIGDPYRSGEKIPETPVTGNGNIVPEANDKSRILRMIAQRKK